MQENDKELEKFENNGAELDSFYQQQYDLPEVEDKFLDTGKGEVIDKSDLTPFDIIKSVAQQTDNEIHDPKKGCKHCYGRGYVGIDTTTKSPVPCSCIFPAKTDNQKMQEALYDGQKYFKPNRNQRRKMQRFLKKQLKKNKSNLNELVASSLKEQKENVEDDRNGKTEKKEV